MKSKPRVKRYTTFTTEVNGEKLERRLSYSQFMLRFIVLPPILLVIAITLLQIFFSEVK